MTDRKIEENWRDLAIDKINQVVPNAGNCITCGSAGTVGIAEHLVSPLIMNPGGAIALGGPTYPQIMLSCSHCGFVRYFNYLLLTTDEPQLDLNKTDG